MTELTNPEALNRRLAASVFLTHPADRVFFDALICRIRGMAHDQKRDIEKYLPDVNEAGAWSRAFAIWEALVIEQNKPTDPQVRVRVMANAATEQEWNRYIGAREHLISHAQRDMTKLIREYLGLKHGDLDTTMTPAPNGNFDIRRPGWEDISNRIHRALDRWETMGESERSAIPQAMAQRRLAAANQEMATRLSSLEAKGENAA
jgi:hypothetical protein